jgi:hypothetical protein
MKNIFTIGLIISLFHSCCKTEDYNILQTDSTGNIVSGDTSLNILKQDAQLTWETDSICSQLLNIKGAKLRGCNDKIKVVFYPNPFKETDTLYCKIQSSSPIYSYAIGNSSPASISLGFMGLGKNIILSDISYYKPTLKNSTFTVYVATKDSCIYNGKINVQRQ